MLTLPPPQTEIALLQRTQAIAGKTLGELAILTNETLPPH